MLGASRRVPVWLTVLVAVLTGCSPVVGLDEAATVPAVSTAAVSTAATSAPAATGPASPASSVPAASAETATAGAPAPTPAAIPAPAPPPAPEPPAVPQPFALNLYQEGDFVPQYTFDWCVAASIQMAHNLIDDTGGATWADPAQQSELWEMTRARSSDSFNGANPLGWAQVLTEAGMGPYRVVSIADYGDALQAAARAISETGRPVGLVMWRGRHAWVMSGFESIGNPAQFPEFQVTGVRVLDPLYPHGSGQWGPSPAPNSLLTPEELAAQFVVREPRRWSSGLPTGYMLVLPVAGA